MFKKLLILIIFFSSSYCFAEYYEVGEYLISTKYNCEEGNVECHNVEITVLNQTNCDYATSIGNTINNPRTFDMNGYSFNVNSVGYTLYTRHEISLDIDEGGILSELKNGVTLSEKEVQEKSQLCTLNFASLNSFGCDSFTRENINELQADIKSENFTLKQNTTFPIFVEGSIVFLATDIVYDKIQTDSTSTFFADKSITEFLEEYLEIISRDPCFYDNRSILFVSKTEDYTIRTVFNEDKMTINITVTDHEYIDDFGYPERNYIYIFQKINNKIILVEINSAG